MGGPVGAGIFMVSAKAKTSKISHTQKNRRDNENVPFFYIYTTCETGKVAGRHGGRQAGKQSDEIKDEVPPNSSLA